MNFFALIHDCFQLGSGLWPHLSPQNVTLGATKGELNRNLTHLANESALGAAFAGAHLRVARLLVQSNKDTGVFFFRQLPVQRRF